MVRGDGSAFEKQVLEAGERLSGIAERTPLQPHARLSAATGTEVWVKREDLQDVFSFKIRGAYNFMANIPKEERWKGVVTCSAGQSSVCLENPT